MRTAFTLSIYRLKRVFSGPKTRMSRGLKMNSIIPTETRGSAEHIPYLKWVTSIHYPNYGVDVIHSKATPYSPQRVGDIDTHIGPLVPWLLAQVANDLSIRNTGI